MSYSYPQKRSQKQVRDVHSNMYLKTILYYDGCSNDDQDVYLGVPVSFVDVNSTKIELSDVHDTGRDIDTRLSRRAWTNQVDMARIQLPLLLTKTFPILEQCA